MANTTEVAEKAAAIPSREELERVEKFTREPFAPDPDALRPGTARRRAFDAALAEIEAGLEEPSVEWRQQYSLMLGLERLLADDEPKLADGTVLSAHQVDALSGTLTALIAEAERQNGNGAGACRSRTTRRTRSRRRRRRGRRRRRRGRGRGRGRRATDEPRPRTGRTASESNGADELEEEQLPEQPEDPGAARRFWFEHATGAGKTVAALGFVEGSRTGGTLILTHRRNLVEQFLGELQRPRLLGPHLARRCCAARTAPTGP